METNTLEVTPVSLVTGRRPAFVYDLFRAVWEQGRVRVFKVLKRRIFKFRHLVNWGIHPHPSIQTSPLPP